MQCKDCGDHLYGREREGYHCFNKANCLTRQLEQAKAEIDRLRKIADATEWLDCDESRPVPEMYCPLCESLKSRGHRPYCLFSESADKKASE